MPEVVRREMNNMEQNFLIDELHYQKTTGASDLSFKRIGGKSNHPGDVGEPKGATF
jgi:hypothetical protein